jgi:oligoribonuclease NrnB/cAMP/cGMP phosphodiesterase (DHH superfamily)
MIKVWYHANCNDGLAAAAVIHSIHGDAAIYTPVQYGKPHPDVELNDEIVIVDFSYPRNDLKVLAQQVKSVTVLDHHKTAEAELAGIMNDPDVPMTLYVAFDQEHSGAAMAWDHYYPEPNYSVPMFIELIEDRDLWKFKYTATNELNAGLELTDRTPADWADILFNEPRMWAVVDDGKVVIRQKQAVRKNLINNVHWVKIGEYSVPAVNSPVEISDLAADVLKANPSASFAVIYFDTAEDRVFSLRSRSEQDVDVSAIAKRYGGGGHKNAAGFKVPIQGNVL